ncbi:MAG: hypothetical protein ACLVFC_13140 [Subdoligranulum sp.]
MVEMNMVKTAAASKKGQKGLLCRFRCAIEQIAVSANENLSVNNDISVSLSITFYEK